MKTTNLNQFHLTGKTAYSIFWALAFDCDPDFETITSSYLNLEIIINNNGELAAYRYDAEEGLSDLLDKDGEWQEFDPEIIAKEKEFFQTIDEFIAEYSIRLNKNELKRISCN